MLRLIFPFPCQSIPKHSSSWNLKKKKKKKAKQLYSLVSDREYLRVFAVFWHRIYLGGVCEAWRELSAHFAVAAADAASSCSQSWAGFSSMCV